MRRALIDVLIASTLAVPVASQEGTPHDDVDSARAGAIVRGALGERLDDWLTRSVPFGLHAAVLVEQDGEVILRRGYGLADRAAGRRMTWRTRFDVGSLAKQFTAAAVAEQVQRGSLQWDSELGQLWPDVPEDKAGITVHQLLTHTAGLPYQLGAESPLTAPLQSTPGERHRYSNAGYALLARVVETVSRQPLAEVTGELFARAGVGSIGLTGQPMDWADQAHGYVDDFDFGTPEQIAYDATMRGAGGYACTVSELYQWVQALEAGGVLDAEIVSRMLTDHVEGPAGYGYGWFVLETSRGTPLYRHMGTYNGFNAELRRYREEDRTIAFLSNSFVGGRALRDAIVNRLALQLAGDAVPEPPRAMPWDAATATGVLGVYESAEGVQLDVTMADGELVVSGRDQAGWSALFGATDSERGEQLVAHCAERTRQLLEALRRAAPDEVAKLTNPGWVRAHESLAAAWRRLQDECGGVEAWAVVGTAVRDAAAGNAVTVVETTGPRGHGRLEIVWTRNGALGSATGADLPGRRLRWIGEGRYAAFDLFSGITVECEFKQEPGAKAPRLRLRSGDAQLALVRQNP
ncbi:MAG: serine hydrolase domain-containing protein [Planctomycetota bacterium]